ncbi:sensor histidine kinase [Humibacter ginsengisoli]
MSRRRPGDGTDAAAISHASRVVTAQITVAAAAIVVLVVALSVAFIKKQSEPRELLEKPAPGQTKIYVDANEMLVALIVVGIIAIALAGLMSWVIARRAVRPLGEALRIQRTFVADASHELRTPVAVVAARVELLGQEIDAGTDTAENLAGLRDDVRVLGDVITDLLLTAAPPADAEPERLTSVAALSRATIADLRMIAGRRDITLSLIADDDLEGARLEETQTRVPASTLRRCIVALVDNAIAHSPDGGSVEVVLASARDRGYFTLSVRDHGGGIIGIDPKRLFERFAHGDGAARDGARSGFGIGLALVRDIAERYGGRIEIADTSPAGTTFTLTLPRA